jgi:metalloendopeptidase OMA1, mitochondrial
MCWRCDPREINADDRAIDVALERAVLEHLSPSPVSRRFILRAGMVLLVMPAAQALQSCATVPVTGRSQLRLISDSEEAQLGVAAFQQLRQEEIQKGRLLTEREDPADHARVKRVADRVIGASGLGNAYHWDYMLINAPKTVNAAAIAGGRIIVYTGILPVAQSDAGLATILGHEVSHVMAHHTAERVSQTELVNVGAALTGEMGGPLLGAVVPAAAELGYLLPYSRAQESEADHIGLLLMAKAAYDPREAVALWHRMERSTGGSGRAPEFLSTHPNPGTRIANLQAWMPEAWPYYQNNSLPLPNLQ